MSAVNLSTKLQSQEIYLDSQYASVNHSVGRNSDVYFFLQTPIIVGNDHDIVLRLENFVLPISFFVCSSTNQTLKVNNVPYTISEGNYNAITLKAELEVQLGAGITISYDQNTNQFTFEADVPFTFNSSSTCFKLLGFQEGINHVASFVGARYMLTSDYIINLSGSSVIYVDIPNLSTHNISSRNNGGFSTIVKSVVCDVPYGSVLSYVNNTNAAVVLGEKYISYFRIRLMDDDYNLLDLKGQHFTCTLEVFYYNNGKPPGFTGNLTDIAQEQERIKSQISS